MSFDDFFKVITAIAGAVVGWLLNVLWQSHRDLQNADKELAAKVQEIEVLVAGQYVRRDEFRELSEALFKKLDSISDKLDKKVDK